MTRPIWLLDVDGTIAPLRQDGASQTRFLYDHARPGLLSVPYDAHIVSRIQTLHDSGQVEVRWLTTWAAEALADWLAVGLGPFERVEPRVGRWSWEKANAVGALLTDHPGTRIVWTDDDIAQHLPDDFPRTERLLTLSPDPQAGLTHADLDRIETWLGVRTPLRPPGGVWEVTTKSGSVILLDLDEGQWKREPAAGATEHQADGRWQRFASLSARPESGGHLPGQIQIGSGLRIHTERDRWWDTAPVVAVRSLTGTETQESRIEAKRQSMEDEFGPDRSWAPYDGPLLAAGWDPDDVDLWFGSPHPYLHGLRPADAMRSDPGLLRRLIENQVKRVVW